MDKSPVSLTGHFTGQVWCRHDISPPRFSSTLGRVLYRAQQPFGWLSAKLYGADLESMLVVRHRLIDRLVEAEITGGTPQILEIASGLSSRSLRMLKRHPGLKYIDADLPQMVAWKRERLNRTERDERRYGLCEINILRESGELNLESVLETRLETSKPALVITEGLVNYFSLVQMQAFWRRLSLALSSRPGSTYIFEIWPRTAEYQRSRTLDFGLKAIKVLTRQQIPLHFSTDESIIEGLKACGFTAVTVHDPGSKCLFRVVVAR